MAEKQCTVWCNLQKTKLFRFALLSDLRCTDWFVPATVESCCPTSGKQQGRETVILRGGSVERGPRGKQIRTRIFFRYPNCEFMNNKDADVQFQHDKAAVVVAAVSVYVMLLRPIKQCGHCPDNGTQCLPSSDVVKLELLVKSHACQKRFLV